MKPLNFTSVLMKFKIICLNTVVYWQLIEGDRGKDTPVYNVTTRGHSVTEALTVKPSKLTSI